MATELHLGDIAVDVVFKDIKHIHLSVYPPDGRVRIAAPARMNLDSLRVYAVSRLAWIKQQQRKLREQARETPREFLDRESHSLWGSRYLLKVIEEDAAPSVALNPGTLLLRVRPGTSEEKRQAVIAAWYRQQLREAATGLIARWETVLGVQAGRVFVQRMKTRWGSCNPASRAIRLNTELAKKPVQCLEYIVAHELTHLLERHHNARFTALLDEKMPQWRQYRDMLNRLPLGHEEWD
ncbi:SprT family zinc-dependent metalloprotease [uncultured Thiodictyon sp.]|uniref:M48 family metallopeptidase n=1 Tax=uncultured Thiodictyon sp. TaxID=1846217 RepID=UPI0025D83E2D|nr:SprT family zinc-dependent metalloprotease [uncultured Thiodictyon sp.]